MLRTVLTGVGVVLAAMSSFYASGSPEIKPVAAHTPYRSLLDQYCITCHSEALRTAGLTLSNVDVEKVGQSAPIWEKVLHKMRSRAMPPSGMPRPDDDAYDSFADYLETKLDHSAAANPNPGRTVLRRLNRAEYSNVIRDLLALEIDEKELLPVDDSGYGFDNIGDVLSVSPMLVSRYMSAARKITQNAIGNSSLSSDLHTYEIPKYLSQEDRTSEDLPFGSRGVAVRHFFPVDGEYMIQVRLKKNFNDSAILGLAGGDHHIKFLLDREKMAEFVVTGEGDPGNVIVDGRVSPGATAPDDHLRTQLSVKAGSHAVGVIFPREPWAIEQMLRPVFTSRQLNEPSVGTIAIQGPLKVTGLGDTVSRQKIFMCRPSGVQDEELCAEKILSTLARRAYRRPITEEDLVSIMIPYHMAYKEGGFEAGIKFALQRILISPEFLFLIERDPEDVAPNSPYSISDLELASRLSFFLWSSMPDDALLELAERGDLRTPGVLEAQVKRMVKDPRAKALVDNFAGQWTFLRNVSTTSPDGGEFPEFDENLRRAFQKEAELFFQSMLQEDRSVVDLLDADHTFLNERLARHYKIPNVYGSHFRRVTLENDQRHGLLGKGGILMVTSYANRTSPVIRGKWVLENILGTPPPPPPPNVPALEETGKAGQILSMRERLEQHRANPACSVCHNQMDPLGFALENFDAIGRWRDSESGKPIDSAGALADGTSFHGPSGLRKVLLSRRHEFVLNVTEKLMTYAVGRGVEYYDFPTVRSIMREAASGDYQWSSLILGIVKSSPFQMRRSKEL